MKNSLLILCATLLFSCGSGIPTEPNYPEPEIKYITIYQNDNPIEMTPPQITNRLDGIFAWFLCRNKSDSVWFGHPEVTLENADSRGFFEAPCKGSLTTKFDFSTMSPTDTLQSIQPGEQVEAWILCKHDWVNIPSIIPWFSMVSDQ